MFPLLYIYIFSLSSSYVDTVLFAADPVYVVCRPDRVLFQPFVSYVVTRDMSINLCPCLVCSISALSS